MLLIESGGGSPEAATSSMLDVETTDLPIGREARVRGLGGTTQVWWGGSALLAETDLAPRPWLGAPGWPIDRSELMPYYSQGCRVLGIPDLTAVSIDRFVSRRGFLIRTRRSRYRFPVLAASPTPFP